MPCLTICYQAVLQKVGFYTKYKGTSLRVRTENVLRKAIMKLSWRHQILDIMSNNQIQFVVIKTVSRDWRGGWESKGTCCFCRGPSTDSKGHQKAAPNCLKLQLILGDPTPTSTLASAATAHIGDRARIASSISITCLLPHKLVEIQFAYYTA